MNILRERLTHALTVAAAFILFFTAADASTLKVSALPEHDWWWLAPEVPALTLQVSDSTGAACEAELRITVTTDDFVPVKEEVRRVAVPAGRVADIMLEPGITAPGFYRLSVYDGNERLLAMNFGYEPENIVSLPDAQSDLRAFWDEALAELAGVDPQYNMEPMPDMSGKLRKVYLASMRSLGGDTICGYVAIPVEKGTYPVHIYYNGYGSEPWCVDADSNSEWIDFVIFTRGQGLCKKCNKYGDWITFGVGDPHGFYYRGAFMDVVRAIDFIYQLPQTDRDNIFAEGGSQGGAFTLVSAALDNRVAAIAPYIPFLSDYPDYFNIVHWPADPVKGAAAQAGVADDAMYKMLSYFDIKNLARWIQCPVLMGVGLQDETCPPHTNFSSYNLIDSPKEFVIYPDKGHTVDYTDWSPRVLEFYKKNMR